MALEEAFRRADALVRLRNPPLGPEMDGFTAWLCAQGFAGVPLRRRLWQVAHFNSYLRRLGIKDARQVERSHGERFLSNHLRRCRCKDQPWRGALGTPRSVHSFIDYLSQESLLASSPSESPRPYQGLLEEYLGYLKCERNLAEATIKIHRRYLTPFLEDLGADANRRRLRRLSAGDVQRLFVKYADGLRPTIQRQIQGALRTFLRFCLERGYLKRDLSQAVPRLRTYKLSHVPRGLKDKDVEEILQAIDRSTAVGRRDFAMIQLFATYGVRGGQVRRLKLEDIEWRHNRIRFPALKAGKEVVEPLSEEVGESLLEYLRHGRPEAPYREVFLTTRAPFRPLTVPSTVSGMVAQRMRRAGVSGSPRGSHVFRHAFAIRMLEHGQSLKSIADMLGHRDLNTTFIYTKVDLKILREVPLDWPEV